MAKAEIDKLSKNNSQKTLVIKKVKDIKKSYNDYMVGLKVQTPAPEIKVVEKINTIEKIKQEKKIEEFQFNETIKNTFINSNPEAYTINVTSFNNKKELEKILTENPNLYENSFSYNYSNGTNLIRWNYGIYNTYEEAQKAIEELNKIGAPYYPVIQKVSKEQELYNLNITQNTNEPKKEPEFEYINETSKMEYKEPTQEETEKKIDSNSVKEKFLLLEKVK